LVEDRDIEQARSERPLPAVSVSEPPRRESPLMAGAALRDMTTKLPSTTMMTRSTRKSRRHRGLRTPTPLRLSASFPQGRSTRGISKKPYYLVRSARKRLR